MPITIAHSDAPKRRGLLFPEYAGRAIRHINSLHNREKIEISLSVFIETEFLTKPEVSRRCLPAEKCAFPIPAARQFNL